MKTLEKHVINKDTAAIVGEVDQHGKAYSIVYEGLDTFIVNMSPVCLIEHSLRYYCSSLKGACEGSRSIFGDVNMLPIIVYSPLEMYWFPCYSPYRLDGIWFALNHVVKYEKMNTKNTRVSLTYGHSLVLGMTKQRYVTRLQNAAWLRYIDLDRTGRRASFYYQHNPRIQPTNSLEKRKPKPIRFKGKINNN